MDSAVCATNMYGDNEIRKKGEKVEDIRIHPCCDHAVRIEHKKGMGGQRIVEAKLI